MEDKMRDIIFESAKESVKEYIKNCSNARIQAISNMNIPECIKFMIINSISNNRDMFCRILKNM